jgi:Ribonuclease G/E
VQKFLYTEFRGLSNQLVNAQEQILRGIEYDIRPTGKSDKKEDTAGKVVPLFAIMDDESGATANAPAPLDVYEEGQLLKKFNKSMVNALNQSKIQSKANAEKKKDMASRLASQKQMLSNLNGDDDDDDDDGGDVPESKSHLLVVCMCA